MYLSRKSTMNTSAWFSWLLRWCWGWWLDAVAQLLKSTHGTVSFLLALADCCPGLGALVHSSLQHSSQCWQWWWCMCRAGRRELCLSMDSTLAVTGTSDHKELCTFRHHWWDLVLTR